MNEYLKEQTEIFLKDSKKVFQRRQDWPAFEKWAIDLIQSYIKDASANGHYEFLYVITNNDIPNTTTTNQSFIQFYAGSHPTGISKTVIDKINGKISLSGVTENSGCLSIVQDPKGGVFFIAFPSKSEVLSWKDEYLILKHFSRPNKIEWYDLKKAIEFYLRFARYTSIYSNQTIQEKMELWWIKFKFISIINYIFRGGASFGAKLIASVHTGLPIGSV